MKKNIIFVVVPILLLVLLFLGTTMRSKKVPTDGVVSNALRHVAESQLATGELPSSLCLSRKSESCIPGNNVFLTASALYSLGETNKILKDTQAQSVMNKSLSFLDEQRDKNDLWRFWNKDYPDVLNPDLDDTAIASFVLEKYSKNRFDNLKYFASNKLPNGSFYTWVPDNEGANEIDISVVSNIILYLNHKNQNVDDVCSYLNDVIENNKEKQEVYTWNTAVVYYNYSKAYQSGVECLSKSKDKITQRIKASQRENGSVDNSVLSTSMSILALLNYDDNNNEFLAPAISYIRSSIDPTKNGFSKKYYFNDFYFLATTFHKEYFVKSDVFSTILAIEALVRYDNLSRK